MKKVLTAIAAAMVLSGGFIKATTPEFVSIDSLYIMQKSQEGKELSVKIQKEIEAFQGDVKRSQEELSSMQDSLSKQAKALSPEAVQEKTEQITNKKKRLEREFADKEEALRVSIQKKQITLRESQLKVVNEVFEKQKWGAVIDKNTPGLLCVSNAIDHTEEVLRAVDAKYESSRMKKDTKTTVKTAAAETPTENANKPSVKTA